MHSKQERPIGVMQLGYAIDAGNLGSLPPEPPEDLWTAMFAVAMIWLVAMVVYLTVRAIP